jgi:hypothetical protein
MLKNASWSRQGKYELVAVKTTIWNEEPCLQMLGQIFGACSENVKRSFLVIKKWLGAG